MFKGSEIKRLVLVSAVCCMLLILSVSLYMMCSSRSNLQEQTDNMKAAMAENIGQYLQECFVTMFEGLRGLEGLGVGSGGIAELLADQQAVYDLFAVWVSNAYNAEFTAYYNGDTLLASYAKPGVEIPGPDVKPEGGQEFEIVDNLDGREGTFFLFNKKSVLPGDRVVYAIDNTAQVEAIEKAYEDTRSSMVTEQVIVVGIIFLVLLAGSLLLIRYLVVRWLGRPMDRLSGEARNIIAGREVEEEEVREKSLFANLQRLINSGRAVTAGSGRESASGDGNGRSGGKREVDKVIALWAAIVTVLFLVSVAVILIFSISIMNSKSDAIMENVSGGMAAYYDRVYDSLTKVSMSSAEIGIDKELFDPAADIDRQATIERLNGFARLIFDSEAVVSYVETDQGGVYLAATKPGVTLDYKPDEMGDPLTVYDGFFEDGDTVLVTMAPTDYAGFGEQFTYYIIDVSEHVRLLDQLYEDGSGSLLASQLVLALVFLVLGLIVSALAMAWAVRKYITRPIIRLDAISNSLMEGDLDVAIEVDEASGFADMQRLLRQMQELLRHMG